MLLTERIKGIVIATNLWSTCKVHTALEQSFSPSISSLTDIHESERSITMVDGKLPSIMFHCYSIHEPHMGDSGLILVATGEIEVPVKALVGSMIACSGMTCSVRSVRHITVYLQQKFNAVGFNFLLYMSYKLRTHSKSFVHTWTQCNSSTVGSHLLDLVVHCPLQYSCD